VHPDGTAVEYDRDAKGRVTVERQKYWNSTTVDVPSAYSQTGWASENAVQLTSTAYTYNAFGLVTGTQTTESTGKKIVTNSEYHTTGNLIGVLKGETDANGQCTQYFYNTNNGRLEAVIYPNETGAPIGMKIYRYGQAEGVFDEYFFEKTEKEQVDRFDQPVLFCSPIL